MGNGITRIYAGTPTFLNVAATTTPTALPSAYGRYLEIKNLCGTGAGIVADHGAGTPTFTIPDGIAQTFHLQHNASELRVAMSAGSYTIDCEVWG